MRELHTLFGVPQSRSYRWAIEPTDDEGLVILSVKTARGTGPGAYSSTVMAHELMLDRRGLATAIWDTRRNAMRWRRSQLERGYGAE
jgi:hypothetical protein